MKIPVIYEYIKAINNLFISAEFIPVQQIINKEFYNIKYTPKTNYCDRFILNLSSDKIEITIPIKNNNVSFKTELKSLEDVYKYLEFHINNYLNKI